VCWQLFFLLLAVSAAVVLEIENSLLGWTVRAWHIWEIEKLK
jgi:hypothetical protein